MPAVPDAKMDPIPFDPLDACLGIFLVLQGLLSRRWPHRIYFLLDSLWFLILAVDTTLAVAAGSSPLWLGAVVLQAWLILTGLGYWRRFAQNVSSNGG